MYNVCKMYTYMYIISIYSYYMSVCMYFSLISSLCKQFRYHVNILKHINVCRIHTVSLEK